jgi:PAS domain S-box-containing protein
VLAVARDITERKQAERALQAREEQYRAIFDGAGDAMALWSRDMRIVDVNRAFTPMFGYTREESVGAVFGVRLPRDEVERRKVLFEQALAGLETQLETVSVRRNGERFDVELRSLPIMHRGEPHVLAVSRDITARRQAEAQRTELEAQLRQAQKMEAIGQLTGGIAHDFNNILTSVIGYVVLASERAENFGDGKLVHQLEQAHVAAQRARDLIAQMLTFARRQRGARAVLALPALVRQTVQLLRATLPSSIELDAETDDAAPPVEADAVQIEQVLFNLAINARDAIGSHSGRIRVRLRAAANASWHCASCRARVDGAAPWVELSVADSGSGIAPEVLERMFDPFYTTKEVGRGSGMGLAMVHGIVHDHGGHLRVETTRGKGSVFRVLLPPARRQAAESASPAGPGGLATPRERLHGRVLVVEDQAMVAEFMGELLDAWGLDVALQRDPLQALRQLEDPAFVLDVLITDQTMPNLTGLELSRRAVLARPTLPVLLYTGDAGEFDAAELRRCGVRAALRKPIAADELRAVLRELLQAGATT